MSQLRRKFLTREEIKLLLLRRIKQSGLKPTQWAIQNKVSATRVSFVLRDKEPPGPKLIAALGVDPTPHYPITFKIKETSEDQKPNDDTEVIDTTEPEEPDT